MEMISVELLLFLQYLLRLDLTVHACADEGSYSYELPSGRAASTSTTSRLSLVPWTSQHQPDEERDMLINAGHHFRFAQNLRQNQAASIAMARPNNVAPERVLDQLATNMLFQGPMPQTSLSPEPARVLRNEYGNRFNQLQPQIQQVTPPFYLSMLFDHAFMH